MRRTGGHTLSDGRTPGGNAASSLGYGCSQAPTTLAAVCGALRSGLSSLSHSP